MPPDLDDDAPRGSPIRMAKRVAVLVFDGSDLLDIASSLAVFASAADHAPPQAASARLYETLCLSMNGGVVRTDQGVPLETKKAWTLRDGEIDTLIVVGGAFDVLTHARLTDWLRHNHGRVRRVASVCAGAFFLAGAGLLDGRRATTHWSLCDRLRRTYPKVQVMEDAIYLPGDHVWTSAGVTSGIDMALAMVEEDYGRELALTVARYQVVFLKRPGGQSQFSASLRAQQIEGALAPLLEWIARNPAQDLRTQSLADRANMSLRNFFRTFVQATGSTPADWVELTRLDVAKRLLEQTSQAIDQIAYQSGFGSYDRMRKAFARRLRITPGQYRERFSRCSGSAPELRAALLSAAAA
jgi:transcriptional regulator GlxA family with amidase domain